MIPLLTTLSTVLCPHGGKVVLSSANTDAQVDGGYVLLQSDVHTVAGCAFTPGPKPQPCVTVRWSTGTTQAKIKGVPLLNQSSTGICFSAEQVPQGSPIVIQTQSTAKAT